MEKLKDIIRNNKMSTRPEYYSGRGATTSDLNHKILEGIYQDILKEYGKTAAKNFVNMVDDIKIISATTFLEELYMLFRNNWKYIKKKEHASGISIPKNEKGEYDENSVVSGMFGLISAMSSGNRDQTMEIKSHFLKIHGVKQKEVYYSDGFNRYRTYE